jgi:hypothetical protein
LRITGHRAGDQLAVEAVAVVEVGEIAGLTEGVSQVTSSFALRPVVYRTAIPIEPTR